MNSCSTWDVFTAWHFHIVAKTKTSLSKKCEESSYCIADNGAEKMLENGMVFSAQQRCSINNCRLIHQVEIIFILSTLIYIQRFQAITVPRPHFKGYKNITITHSN